MNQPSSGPNAAAPRILLVGLLPGLGGLHMPRHLARAGFEIGFAGVETCMAFRSGHIRERYAWKPAEPHFSFAPFVACVRRFRPHWVAPLDELASARLQQAGLGELPGGIAAFPEDVLELVRRCMGEPRGYGVFAARRHACAIARQAGIAAPAQADVADIGELLAFAGGQGWPLVVKREQSMGGVGVLVLENEQQARAVAAERNIGADGAKWVAQRFAPGRLGMHAVLADRGRVLAGVSAVQVRRRSQRATAPSSVVQLCGHDAMAESCAAFVAASGVSGFHGWDFQLDDAGRALMIEHNPRPISISHLGGLIGSDLCAALAGLCGIETKPDAAAHTERQVALFPDEWRRDPRSPMLYETYHDAPWDDPALLASVLNSRGRFV